MSRLFSCFPRFSTNPRRQIGCLPHCVGLKADTIVLNGRFRAQHLQFCLGFCLDRLPPWAGRAAGGRVRVFAHRAVQACAAGTPDAAAEKCCSRHPALDRRSHNPRRLSLRHTRHQRGDPVSCRLHARRDAVDRQPVRLSVAVSALYHSTRISTARAVLGRAGRNSAARRLYLRGHRPTHALSMDRRLLRSGADRCGGATRLEPTSFSPARTVSACSPC